MKYPLAGVCSRDIQCETGHLRYSILKNKTAILFPEPVDNCILNVNFYKKNRKKLKKVVDKPLEGWYYSQRCSERQH